MTLIREFKINYTFEELYSIMCKKFNLPSAASCPYDEYIVQLPYVFDTEKQFYETGGRTDLVKVFQKKNNRWVPL